MTTDSLDHALTIARHAARLAAAVIRPRWNGALQVAHKGDVDLVTDVDLAAEAVIVETLRAAFPDDDVVAEESGGQATTARRRWYVDPLDGTTNFSHGFPHFAVSIALVDAEGPCVGVVHAPLLDWCFHAVRGRGAFLGEERLRASATPDLDRSLLATGFPYDRRTNPDNNVHRVAHLIRRCQGIRRAGSAALDLSYVAAGWLDGYWEDRLKAWDLAAGALLVREAGGRVSRWDGAPLGLEAGEIIASNGIVHDELIEALAAAGQPPPFFPSEVR